MPTAHAKVMKALFQGMQGHELAVVLAQENATIYFTETHVFDLGVVIAAEPGIKSQAEWNACARPQRMVGTPGQMKATKSPA